MAEVIARRVANEMGLHQVSVRSAGTHVFAQGPATDEARWAASEAGLDLDDHRSRALNDVVVARSDLILTMGTSHLAKVIELGGGDRAQRLGDFAGAPGDVVDPYGAPGSFYQQTFEELERLIRPAMARIAELAPGGSGA